MGRSQGIKRTRSLTPISSSQQIIDCPSANKKRLFDDGSKRSTSAPPAAGRKGRSRHNVGISEWTRLLTEWSETSGSLPLVPVPSRLRYLVAVGPKAIVDVQTCNEEWYKKRAKVNRKKEEVERLHHELKVTRKQCSQKHVTLAQNSLQDAEQDLSPFEKELACLTRSLSVSKKELLAFGQDILSRLKADNVDDAPRVFRLLLARCLDVEEDLPALTPVTTADALGVCFTASRGEPKGWNALVSRLYLDNLVGLHNVVLQDDEVLSTPEAMFRDMAKSFPRDLLKPLLGAVPVSYATMCSGTESPIMAMQMFSDACQELHGTSLNFDHRFSCEIDPTKQGYIYRNFDVKLLFRDIQELGGQDAHTAWNSLETVPSADAAVAGTSCVDFSSMNGHKKAIDEGGESGDTFQGLLEWVKVHRPILVCNENVMGNGQNNPWPEMQRRLEDNGYAARFLSFDSKEYYIPQTRTRRYMIGINVGKGAPMIHGDKRLTRTLANQVLDDWEEIVTALKRPYTATLDHFLYPDDDPIVAKARQQLESQKSERRHEVDWTRSLMRNNKAREDGNLGDQRPLTRWDDADNIHPSDDADWRWWAAQPNRVKDVAEVCFLRCVAQGQDPRHKPMYVNLSQNPERNDSSKQPPGLCPCLTPNEIPLITCRGGPIVAEERLKLQGLPVDSLTFTRETQQDLSSLAGNAMSSTVVGPVLLAAWAALGKAGYRRKKARNPTGKHVECEADQALLHTNKKISSLFTATTPSGAVGCQLSVLCQAAAGSSKLCPSERGYELKCGIAACERCGHSASAGVRGTPCGEASFTKQVRPRELPDKFEGWLMETLPTHLMISGASRDILQKTATESAVDFRSAEAWAVCCAAAFPASGVVLHGVERCRYHWRATWRHMGDTKQRGGARLELVIGSRAAIADSENADLVCQWRLFANAEACAVQAVRGLLIKPFAVADVPLKGKELIAGVWQLRVPVESQVMLRVTGSKLGPSWESKLGLGFDDKSMPSRQETGLSATAWDELKIDVVDRDWNGRLDVEGIYDRSSDCGAPNGSLHVRRGGGEPLYLFREADPVKHASADRFVFANSHDKLPLGEAREHRALLTEGWRPATDAGRLAVNVVASIPGQFETLQKNQILLSLPVNVRYASPQNLDLAGPATDAQLLTKVALPMAPACQGLWSTEWRDAAQRGREGPARSLHWLRGAVSAAILKHKDWQPLPSKEAAQSLAKGLAAHDVVAPKLPSVKWVINPKTGALVPQERTQEASTFERARRACPRPLAALCRSTKDENGEVLVAARPQICALQAATLLSKEALPGTNVEGLELSYRIFATNASDPEVPDAVWITLPESDEGLPLHGRYSRERLGCSLTYLRESCGTVRLEKLCNQHWQATGPKGRVLMVSDGPQGTGVMPHQVQAWCLGNFKGVNHKILVEARWQRTFTIEGNETDEKDPAVPSGWNPKFPLWPMQCRSVSWLRKMEESTTPYMQEAMENFEIPSLGLRIEGRARMPTHGNRAVLADGVGFGKTAVVLARLMDKSGDTVPTGDLTKEGKMTSKATIVFVPPHLVGQWIEEKDKFINPKAGLETIQINSARDMELLTVKEVCEADLIVCNFDILQSSKYLDRLSDLATGGSRSINCQKGRYQPAIYEEVVDSLRKVARSMIKPSSQTMKLNAMKKTREKNFQDLKVAECESNMTRKLMNEQRKKRRKGVEMTLKQSSDITLKPLWEDEQPETLLGLVNMPFEFFDFRRLVCDEVSFASSMACTALSYGVRGRSQLCLTGTPGLDSTKAVSQLARTVGVVIGPDEPPPEELGKRNEKESTAAESLYHFLRVPDEGRYRRQTECAREWLNRFCRHNEPAKAGIPVQSHIRRVIMTPLEQVLYSERDRDLRGLDVTAILRKGRGARGGQKRDVRLRASLRGCNELQTAQELLMYQASCNESAEGKIADVIAGVRKEREQQLDHALEEFSGKTRDLQSRHQELQRLAGGCEDDFARLVQRINTGAQTVDHELDTTVRKIFAEAKANPKRDDKLWAKIGKDDEKEDEKDGGEKKRIDDLEMKIKEGVNAAHGLGSLLKEITNRHRTLRFFDSVADGVLRPNQCAKCHASGESAQKKQFLVLPCGHRGCKQAFMPKVNGEGRCAVKGCAQQNVTEQDLLHISSLMSAKEDEETVTAQGPYGSKFAAVVCHLQQVLNEDTTNRALVFCQMDPLRDKLSQALGEAEIPFAKLDGTPQQMHQAMQEFKSATGDQKRVLLLALDERCAGANLTAANHVVFAHPVLQNGSRSPSDIETQAIGRARRFGQTRTVNVWRFLSQQTIEERLEERNQLERHE